MGSYKFDAFRRMLFWIYRPEWPNDVLNNHPIGNILTPFIFGDNVIQSQSVMIKKSALLAIGGFQSKKNPRFLIDYPTWMELGMYGRFYFISSILGYWRQHPFQMTRTCQENLYLEQLSYIELFLKDRSRDHHFPDLQWWGVNERPSYQIYYYLTKMSLVNKNMPCSVRYISELIKASIPPYRVLSKSYEFIRLGLRFFFVLFMSVALNIKRRLQFP